MIIFACLAVPPTSSPVGHAGASGTLQLLAQCEENATGIAYGDAGHADYHILCYAKPSCTCTDHFTVNMSVSTSNTTLSSMGWSAKLYNETGAEISSAIMFGANYFNLTLVVNSPANAPEGTQAVFDVKLQVDYGSAFYANVTTTTSIRPSGNHPPVQLSALPNATIEEDTEYISEYNVSSYFSDPDGDTILVKVIYGNTCNFLSKLENDKLRFTPRADWFGIAVVHLLVTDYYWQENFTINISVTPVPDAPRMLAGVSSFGMLVNTTDSERLNLSSIFYDPDGEHLNFSFSDSGLGNIDVDIQPDGRVIITSHEWTGTEQVTFTATDPTGLTANFTVSIVVVRLNLPPMITEPLYSHVRNITMPGDVEYVANFSYRALFSDPDGEAITFTTANASDLSIFLLEDGNISIEPKPFVYGTFNVSIYATDGYHAPVEARFVVVVQPVNHPPAATQGISLAFDDIAPYTEPGLIDRLFVDPDGDTLEITFVNSPYVNMTLEGTSVIFVPCAIGTFTIQIGAYDGKNLAYGFVSVTIRHADRAPRIASANPSGVTTMSENSLSSFSVTAIDDDGDALSYQWLLDGAGSPALLCNMSNCTYISSYDSAGAHTITALVYANGSFAMHNFSVVVTNVNRPPTANIKAPFSDYNYPSTQPVEFSCRAADPDNDAITLQWTLDKTNLGDEEKFSLSLRAGKHTVTLRVSDGNLTASDSRIINVVEPNAAPQIDWMHVVFMGIGIGALGLALLFSFSTFRSYRRFKDRAKEENGEENEKAEDEKPIECEERAKGEEKEDEEDEPNEEPAENKKD